MNRSRNTLLIVLVAVAVAVFAGLNMAIGRLAGTGEHDHEAEETQAAAKQGDRSKGDAAPGGAEQSALARRPTDETIGPKDAKNDVVIGWSWTPEVQADPARLEQALAVAHPGAPYVRVRIVNADAVPDAPRGIVVNGQKVQDLPPDGLLKSGDIAWAVSGKADVPRPALTK